MANVCGVSLHVCRIRATRLDDVGNVAEPPNNSYVSANPVSVQLTPTISAGTNLELRGGCDCIIASYQASDILTGYELEFVKGAIEPALEEMMLGGDLITDGADNVGVWFPGPLDCAETQPAVGFEFWTDVWVGGRQSANRPYIHWVFPYTTWVTAATTLENQLSGGGLSGKASANEVWANGPYADQPEPVPEDSPGGYFYTSEALPDAECDYKDVTPAS